MPNENMTNIERFRWKNCLNQTELARQVGVTPATVSAWERRKAFPNSRILPKLAAVLHCKMEELVEAEDAKGA